MTRVQWFFYYLQVYQSLCKFSWTGNLIYFKPDFCPNFIFPLKQQTHFFMLDFMPESPKMTICTNFLLIPGNICGRKSSIKYVLTFGIVWVTYNHMTLVSNFQNFTWEQTVFKTNYKNKSGFQYLPLELLKFLKLQLLQVFKNHKNLKKSINLAKIGIFTCQSTVNYTWNHLNFFVWKNLQKLKW